MLRTQVGGKYHPDDDSVFRVKSLLTRLGVAVSHPIADEIKALAGGHGFAFNPAQYSFAEVERDYYHRIEVCDFHTVCNQFKTQLGYLGSSASLEIAYAMRHRRPIVLLHAPDIATSVDSFVRDFLQPRFRLLARYDFLSAPPACSIGVLTELSDKCVDYDVSEEDAAAIELRVQTLLASTEGNITGA